MGVDFRTQAIHAGYEPLDNGRAAVPPIYASAAFDLGCLSSNKSACRHQLI